MKILLTLKYNSAIEKKIRGIRHKFPQVEIFTDPERTPLAEVNILVGGQFSLEFLELCKSLELIIVPMTGIENIPFDFLKRRSIRLVNSHSNAPYVAERALGMILDLMGRISAYHFDLVHERWHGLWSGGGMEDAWHSIRGRTCGILGTGAIGIHIARLLVPFGCNTIGYRRNRNSCPPDFHSVKSDLHELIGESDIIFVTLPLTDDTYGLIGEQELEMMGGKYLVNMSRGKVISESALYKALNTNVLAGAAIDTWYTYPRGRNAGAPSKYPIHKLKNVVLSPHVGGFSRESLKEVMETTFEQLIEYIEKGTVFDEVDLISGY